MADDSHTTPTLDEQLARFGVATPKASSPADIRAALAILAGDESTDDNPQAKRGRGRPATYSNAFPLVAQRLAAIGATDAEITEVLGIGSTTLYRWQTEHPEFREAIKLGKEAADERIVRSMYQRAAGYQATEKVAFKVKKAHNEEAVEIVDVEKHVPADTTAAIFWLKNRRPHEWRDRREIMHVDGDIEELSTEQLEERLAQLNARAAAEGRLIDVTPASGLPDVVSEGPDDLP